jgi:hypothetical protein
MVGGARGARLYETGTGPRRIDEAILSGGGPLADGVGDVGTRLVDASGWYESLSAAAFGLLFLMSSAAETKPAGRGPDLVDLASLVILTSCDARANPPGSC